MDILVIGYGQTGFEIVKTLSKLKYVSKINIFDPKTKNKLINKKTIFVNDLNKLKNIDYIIIAFSAISQKQRKKLYKKQNTGLGARYAELEINLIALKKYMSFLKIINKKTKIIVVTNPMDLLTNYLRIKLKSNNVIGFGLDFDNKRYFKELNKKIYCVELHGKAIPILNLKTKKEYVVLDKKLDAKLIYYLRTSGTPHKFAGERFNEFFMKLNSNKPETLLVCSKFKNISISYPFEVQKGKIIKPISIKLNKIEKELFDDEIKLLKKEIKKII